MAKQGAGVTEVWAMSGTARARTSVWLLALLFFIAAAFFYSRLNDFPFFYHPDEPRKARQLLTGERDFRHPLLLLTASDLAFRVTGGERTPQHAVRAGRACSALFAAAAVGAFALLAYQQRGLAAMLVAGLFVGGSPHLFEYAHYMKEDTALMLGLALFFLALERFRQTPGLATAFALGVAAGIAASGKYVGVAVGIVGLPFAFLAAHRRAPQAAALRLAGAYLLGFVVAILPLNWPGWLDLIKWRGGFGREMAVFEYGPHAMERTVEWWRPFLMTADYCTLPVTILALGYLLLLARRAREASPVEWTMVAFVLLYLIALGLTGKATTRYFLPAIVLVIYHAALGTVDVAARVASAVHGKRRLVQSTCVATGVVWVSAWQLPEVAGRYSDFQRDHRDDLCNYLNQSVESAAVVLAEEPMRLADAKAHNVPRPISQTILLVAFAADAGTLDEVRARGVTHVAVAENNFRRFTRHGWTSAPGAEAKTAARDAFYKRLFQEGRLVFERKRRSVSVLTPGLRLYEIQEAR